MRGEQSYTVADVKAATRQIVLAGEITALDSIREAVGYKILGQGVMSPNTMDQQVYRILQIMVSEGELKREGRGGRYNAIRYYTHERYQRLLAERAAAKTAADELQAEWDSVCAQLALILTGLRQDRNGKPDLDLDQWQELLGRLSEDR